jgi:hypothetical protein
MIHRLATGVVTWCGARPAWAFLISGLVVLAAAAGLPRLTMAGPEALLGVNDQGEQRQREAAERFGGEDEAVVVMDRGAAGEHRAAADAAMAALARSLADEPRVGRVVWGFSRATVSPKLLLTLPLDQVRREVENLTAARPLLESPTPTQLLRAGMQSAVGGLGAGGLQTRSGEASGAKGAELDLAMGAAVFEAMTAAWTQRMQTPAEERVGLWETLRAATGGDGWEYLALGGDRLIVMRVTLPADGEPERSSRATEAALDALSRHVESVRFRFPQVEMGVTGMTPTRRQVEAELRAVGVRAAGGALLGLLLMTGLVWRSVRLPLLVSGLTAAGWAVSVGLVGWCLGELQPWSLAALASGGVLTLFGVLVWASARARHEELMRAWTAGPAGVVCSAAALGLAGIGLAVGPGVAPGLREAGLALTLGGASTAFILLLAAPAWLTLGLGRGWSAASAVREREDLAGYLTAAAGRRPRWAGAVAAVGVAVLIVGVWQTPSRATLLGYLPAEAEGVEWLSRIIDAAGEGGPPAWVVVHGMAEAHEVVSRLRRLPEVDVVSGIGRLVPREAEEKARLMSELRRELGPALAEAREAEPRALDGDAMLRQLRLAAVSMGAAERLVEDESRRFLRTMAEAANGFVAAAEAATPTQRVQRFAALQREYAEARREVAQLLDRLTSPRPIDGADLETAPDLFSGFVGPGNDQERPLLIQVSPAAVGTAEFIAAVQRVAPEVTGAAERQVARGQALRAAGGGYVPWMLVVLLVVGVLRAGRYGPRWRAGGLAAGLVMVSMIGYPAAVGALGGGMGYPMWLVWPAVGSLVLGWVYLSMSGSSDRQAAVANEAIGLALVVLFVLAAGVRGAGATNLTAAAVGAVLAAAAAVGLGLLLLPWTKRPGSTPAAVVTK